MGKPQIFKEEVKRIATAHHFTNLLLVSSFYISKTVDPVCHVVYKGKISCHIDNEELDSNKNVTWMIEFYVSWSPECRQIAPVFAKISEKYSLPNLKFGKLDVGRYTSEAERFRINVHPTSRQLPTFSLFQDGKEVKRVPFVDKNGRAVRYIFSEENVILDFDLNNLYQECKNNLPKDRSILKETNVKKTQ